MRPAWSIIVFTSLSGFGLGLLFWFGLGFVVINELIDVILFTVLGVMAVSIGLMSSLLHLGHPERAWRGFIAVAFVLVISRRCLCRSDHPLYAHLLGGLVYRTVSVRQP